MSNQEILTKAIQKQCLHCGAELVKKPKQSHAQFDRMMYCSIHCRNSKPRKDKTEAKDMANLHKFWIRRIPKPEACMICGQKHKLALSNKSQLYKNQVDDWQWICYSCHSIYDDVGRKAWETRRRLYGQSGSA